MFPDSLFAKLHRLFFYLLIVFLPTQLGFHLWPEWARVLGRNVDYLTPTVYLTDILIILVIILWLIESGHRMMNHELGIMIKGKKNVFLFSFIILIAFTLINTIFSINQPISIYAWIKAWEFILLGMYIVKTKPSLFMIHNSLFIAVLYSALIAIAQFILQHSIGGPFWWLGERAFTVDTPGIARIAIGGKEMLRSYATFPHPNVLGGFLAIALLLIINKSEKKRVLYWITLSLGTIALFLSFSRSAWMVFVLGMGFLVWSKKKNLFWIPAFAGMTMLPLFFIPLSWADESVVVRQELNAAAANIIKTTPLLGVGLGNFLVALPDHIPSRTIYFLQPVHNIYLLLLSEIGIIGIGFIIIFGYFQMKHESGIMNYGKRVIHYSLFIILLLGLVDHYPLTLQQGRLLLTIFVSLMIQ